MAGFGDQNVVASFGKSGGGFRSKSEPGYPSPIYVVARAAAAHIEQGGQIPLPDGYTPEVLDNVKWISGAYGQPFNVSGRQAEEMAELGATVLGLADSGQLRGELNYTDRQMIEHLTSTVGTIGAKPDLPGGR